ncbi:hypothetical protein FRC19_007176 [Serendipita sp. 401]|nr:hypothetical protein FRC19_007176 [Serendipita sp. 401]KAG8837409.1 hypothetical protein FRC18_009363 [Serendipita sp. 400]KAG9057641.1 hypothetical protein FS842_005085 [Serendipita sp. 407]
MSSTNAASAPNEDNQIAENEEIDVETLQKPNAHLVRARPKLRAIERVPVEIWSMVFEQYVLLDCRVANLLLVCRLWRGIGEQTPRLWRRMLLSADAIPPSLRAGSVHACGEIETVERIRKRAGASLLELTLVLGPNEEQSPSPLVRATLFQSVTHHVLPRVTFLCIIVNPKMSLDLMQESLQGVFSGTLEALESLMIASAHPIGNLYGPLDPVIQMINASSLRLRSIYLENVNRDFITKVSALDLWTRACRITIRNEFDALDATTFERCTRLEFLSFSGELAYADTNHSRKVDYTNLKWFKVGLISMGTLNKLKLNNLHSLVIDCIQTDYPNPSPAPHSIVIPELKVLHLATVSPTAAAMAAPKIETVCLNIPTLKSTDADSVIRELLSGAEGMLKPKHLTITAPVHDKHLLNALRHLPDLISLQLDHQVPFSKMFFREMTPAVSLSRSRALFGRGKKTTKPPLLPKLRALVLDLHKIPTDNLQLDSVKSTIRTMIASRKNSEGYDPLLRVACKWEQGQPNEEFIYPMMCLTCIETHIANEAHNTSVQPS